MEYKFIQLPQSEVEIEVTIPFDEFRPHTERAAVLISEETDIEGFRKGKAPFDIVKNHVGEHGIYERAAEVAIQKTYPEIFRKLVASNQLSASRPPIGRPSVTVMKLATHNPLVYKVRLALLPEVELPDYKAIAARVHGGKKEQTVSDEEVARTLEWLRESRTEETVVDRAAQTGDVVEIDFETRHGGVKIEHGESKNHPVFIGKGKFLPGFEDALVGMKKGDEKTFTLETPRDWHEKSFAGKALEFRVVVNDVKERKLPELTDDFAKILGQFSSLDDLKKNIKGNMLREKEEKENQRVRGTMIDEIAKEARIEVPTILIDAELEKMMGEFQSHIESMGMKWDEYLLHIKKTANDLEKEWRLDAKKRVRSALCLREIAEREHVAPDGTEVEKRAAKFMEEFQAHDESKRTIDPEQLKEYTRGIIRNEKVFEVLENMA